MEKVFEIRLNDGSFEKMSRESFIKMYSTIYFKGECGNVKLGTRKNSCYVDDEIKKILKNGIMEPDDVKKILAWKAGKIKLLESNKETGISYASDWKCAANEIKLYNKEFDIEGFAKYLVDNRKDLEGGLKSDKSLDSAQGVMNKLKEVSEYKPGNMMGTVYLITIIYILSHGEFPIYDRYAKRAIDALYCSLHNESFDRTAPYRSLASKNDKKKFSAVIEEYNRCYIEKLKACFSEEYKTNRDIDRALWAYGHTKTLWPEKKKINRC